MTSGKVPARRQTVGIEEDDGQIPAGDITNLTVYPNPFTKGTKILLPSIDLPGRDASLRIYDITGRLVKTFDLSIFYSLLSTSVVWDGTDDEGRNVSFGIYFCKFTTPEKTEVAKIIFLK